MASMSIRFCCSRSSRRSLASALCRQAGGQAGGRQAGRQWWGQQGKAAGSRVDDGVQRSCGASPVQLLPHLPSMALPAKQPTTTDHRL